MRIFLVLAVCLLLVACAPSEEEKAEAYNEKAKVSGQVIGDVFNPNTCMTDSGCRLGHTCVNKTCVPKNR